MAGRSRILAENLKKAGKSDEDIEKLGLKDDVRRANGFCTYFAADIAYPRSNSPSGASIRSSTCGAPTTAAMWPAWKVPWTLWGWTVSTGWISC